MFQNKAVILALLLNLQGAGAIEGPFSLFPYVSFIFVPLVMIITETAASS
ncbi:hypothetical protein H920_15448 [Fukomys damarensis]|uniref:Uncharacterized protein n=1 Tax=Fukomys damarensis TaxID=885580 RepID=A0A091CYZ4_FUKDA|nr:hypothetical protein H920_15448 [Fukomys damarensis]